ncbi:MAG TPA: Hsp70 family protein [Xanthobacteraceae bacterium]|nr:Hsp70 family protein [Xanthobacteraceae bacterium]
MKTLDNSHKHSLACGLDFGTSNSTLAVERAGQPTLMPVEGAHPTIPSAVFFGLEPQDAFLIGRAAMEAYIEGRQGRLMRSLKSILGSSLIDEKTAIYRRRIAFSDVIRLYIAELKARAEAHIGEGLDKVVLGRPVHFVDNDDEADLYAENTLKDIAAETGFREISFQFEPVAAAFEFERQIARECLVLIADIGGGTSDFTVVRLSPDRHRAADRGADLLANDGLRLGGTDYDRYLSMAAFMPALGHRSLQKRGDIEIPAGPFWDLSTWASVNHLYDPKRLTEIKSIRYTAQKPELIDRLLRIVEGRTGHSVLIEVEAAKIELSRRETHRSDLGWIEPGLEVHATRMEFELATARLYDRLKTTALACVKSAGVEIGDISAVFFTGGTSQLPSVRRAIASHFPDAEIVDRDHFGSVGLGLAIEAKRRYG